MLNEAEINTPGAGLPAIMLEDSNGFVRSLDPGRAVVRFEIEILDCLLKIGISFTRKPVTLCDMVPAARQITDRIMGLLARQLQRSGKTIACKKSCAYCCLYLVPVSSAEALQIYKQILKLRPCQSQAFIHRSCIAGKQIISSMATRPVQDENNVHGETLQELSDWYRKLDLSCPFLDCNDCGIYEYRPLACREYFVLDSCSPCKDGSADSEKRIAIPISVAESLNQTCNILTGVNNTIILPLAIPYAHNNPEAARKTFDSETVVRTFLERLSENISYRAFDVSDNPNYSCQPCMGK